MPRTSGQSHFGTSERVPRGCKSLPTRPSFQKWGQDVQLSKCLTDAYVHITPIFALHIVGAYLKVSNQAHPFAFRDNGHLLSEAFAKLADGPTGPQVLVGDFNMQDIKKQPVIRAMLDAGWVDVGQRFAGVEGPLPATYNGTSISYILANPISSRFITASWTEDLAPFATHKPLMVRFNITPDDEMVLQWPPPRPLQHDNIKPISALVRDMRNAWRELRTVIGNRDADQVY